MSQPVVSLAPMLPLSAATKLFSCTARALRYYEEVGLVSARRDRRNGRCYDAAALRRLEWISLLRRADVPLQDIRRVLRAEGDEARTLAERALQSRRAVIEVSLEAVDDALSRLDEEPLFGPASSVRRPEKLSLVG